MESGLRVRRVRLRPSSGVHSVQRSVQRKDGLFGDAGPVGFAPLDQFDCYAFDGDRVTEA